MLTGSIYSALICMAFVAAVMLAKHLLMQVIGWIMPFDKELSLYGYMMAVFNQVIGIVLLPFIIVAAFAPDPFKKIENDLWLCINSIFFCTFAPSKSPPCSY